MEQTDRQTHRQTHRQTDRLTLNFINIDEANIELQKQNQERMTYIHFDLGSL